MKKNSFSRREFLSTTVKGAALVSAAGVFNSCITFSETNSSIIPRRILGKTGLETSILSFGGGSQFLKNENGAWEKSLKAALNSGINYYDTSPDYTVQTRDGSIGMNGEERYGEILPAYRKDVIIATKVNERESGYARKSVEESLKRMKSDYIDILLMHAINDADELATIENGVYKEMIEMKNEGIVKNIGFSSMDSAERSKELLENLDFDVAELTLSPTIWGNYIGIAYPVAIEKNVGIIATKVMRGVVGVAASAKELFEYAWSQEGVTSTLIGHYGMDTLEENIKLAIQYGKDNTVSVDKKGLEARLAPYAGPHSLPWAGEGYRDAGIIV